MAWFCFNDGFVSVVQSDTDPDILMVRARRIEILETLFDEDRIKQYDFSDYRFRVFCLREEWQDIVSERIENINYSNFKNSVKDEELHKMYQNFWWIHANYQYAAYGTNWVQEYYSYVDNKDGTVSAYVDKGNGTVEKVNPYTQIDQYPQDPPIKSNIYVYDWPLESKKDG